MSHLRGTDPCSHSRNTENWQKGYFKDCSLMFNPFLPFFLIINRTPRYWIPLPSLPVCFLPGYPPLSCRIFFFFSEDIAIASRIFSFDSRRIYFSQIASSSFPLIITNNYVKFIEIIYFSFSLLFIFNKLSTMKDKRWREVLWGAFMILEEGLEIGLRIEYNRYSICWKVTWLQKKIWTFFFL